MLEEKKAKGKQENTQINNMEGKKRFPSKFDLGIIPNSSSGVLASTYAPFFSINSFKDNLNPLIFILHSSSEYLDLNSAYINMQIAIKKESGAVLTATDDVSFTHNLGAALFDDIEVLIQSTPSIRPTALYPYCYHISDLLTRKNPIDFERLRLQHFIQDVSDKFDAANTAYSTRKQMSSESKIIDLTCRLAHPIFEQKRALIPNITLQISLRRSIPAFILNGSEKTTDTKFPYSVSLNSAIMYVKKLVLHPDLIKQHNLLFNSKRINYPIKINSIQKIIIPAGVTSFQSDVINFSSIPNFILVTFLDNANISGKLSNSCFFFKHADISNIDLKCEADSLSVHKNYELDMAKGHYNMAFDATHALFAKFGSNYSTNDFEGQNFLLAFELTPGFAPQSFIPSKHGQIQISCKFKSSLVSSISMLIFCQNNGIIQMSKSQIYTDYN